MSTSKTSLLPFLRRSLLQSLVLHLAVVLGLAQAGVVHWVGVVAGGPWLPSRTTLVLAAGLAVLNAALAPWIRSHRRAAGWRGAVVRRYTELGIATLLVSLVIAGAFGAYAFAAALGSELAFDLFRTFSPLAVAIVAGWVVVGFALHERVATTRIEIPVPDLAPGLAGLRIAQISDLHIGNHLEGERLERMVRRVNALEADLIAITGDIFDFDPSVLEEGSRALGDLRARYGSYAILGNHDVYVGPERVAEAFASHAPGIRLLRDELVRVPCPEPLYLAGIEDPGGRWFERDLRYASLERVAGERPPDGATLLLAHQPEVFAHAAELGFPLVLVGHTHGGQLALPGGQWNLARIMTPWTRGLYRQGDTHLYVNRGLGVGGPTLRLNCPREIALVELAEASASQRLLEHVDQAEAPEPHLLVRT